VYGLRIIVERVVDVVYLDEMESGK